ncbi:MAG TPA: AI-2E family transporter [Candidatus Nanopelagicales bacterium]|nr:AI-2E family transporter [Candidatus Nanopelagicales bacterium]
MNDRAPGGDTLGRIVSPREARLVFWLVVIALVTFVATGASGTFATLTSPAIILFVAWLLAYVLEPPVSWLQRHLPLKSRGIAVAVTYVVTAVVAIAILGAVGVALLNAAVSFVDALPRILDRVVELLRPIVAWLGISLPSGGDALTAIRAFLASYAGQLADTVSSIAINLLGVTAGLVTAVIISVGLAAGQVSLLGWLRRFLPSSTYRDLTELERAIAVSFGGFVRGRLLIGSIYGGAIALAAVVLGVPYAPLIGVVAGLIVFIPWIGPLIGWAVLPSFAIVLAPDAVVAGLVIGLIVAAASQLLVTQLVMGAAVNMSPVAVFVVVFIGAALAGVMGAIFAIPVAAAILAITDYLRRRDVLLRSDETHETDETDDAAQVAQVAQVAEAGS